MSKIVGIDLGTTNSLVAVLEGGEPVVITTAEGSRLLPSVVAFTKTGERLVGQIAKRQAVVNPENTVSSIKRFMGRRFSEVAEERQRVPYKVVEGPDGDARVFIAQTGKTYTPQEISAMILGKLKKDAEAYLGEPVTQAVITVPAYFNDSQRQATKDAGKIAGLEVLRIINEPTASALAYGLEKKKDETILVFDLGGGTFDVSVLEVGDGVVEVKATNGDTHLGGDDWDAALTEYLADEFNKAHGIDLRKDRQALQRLKEAAEKAKIELSSMLETEVNLPFITADASGPQHLQIKITRAKLEQISAPLVQRCRGPFQAALRDAKRTPQDLDELVLVGGATRMPMIQQLVRELSGGKEPNKSVNPDEVVAVGAAIQASVLSGETKDVLAARRDAAFARHRDDGGCHDDAHPAQHDDPHPQERSVQHGGRCPDCGGHSRAARRAPDGGRQHEAGHVPAGWPPARAARRASDRGHVRPGCQRHPERRGQRQGDRPRTKDRHHRQHQPE